MENRKVSLCVLVGGLWPGEAGDGLTEGGGPEHFLRVRTWLFVAGSKLEAGTEMRYSVNINQILAILIQ